VAVAIDDFARRDPDRMAHLRRLLAKHRRGSPQATPPEACAGAPPE
jgi:hypothetical protein